VIKKFIRSLERKYARRLGLLIRRMDDEIDQLTLPRFANEPQNLNFATPRRINNPSCIWIGDNVSFGPGCMLNASRKYPGSFMQGAPGVEVQEFEPTIKIGNRVSATGYVTVSAVDRVEIGDDALLASHIFISDNQHGHSVVETPFKYQKLEGIAPVSIGRGCWIGEHVVIMPGVSIGELSIVGANSVVTADVPPRSIAVGSPAKVIRVWNDDSDSWSAPP
jgi:acetyltransferase-like isoleucine patch superfamily enzyme